MSSSFIKFELKQHLDRIIVCPTLEVSEFFQTGGDDRNHKSLEYSAERKGGPMHLARTKAFCILEGLIAIFILVNVYSAKCSNVGKLKCLNFESKLCIFK